MHVTSRTACLTVVVVFNIAQSICGSLGGYGPLLNACPAYAKNMICYRSERSIGLQTLSRATFNIMCSSRMGSTLLNHTASGGSLATHARNRPLSQSSGAYLRSSLHLVAKNLAKISLFQLPGPWLLRSSLSGVMYRSCPAPA